MRMQIAQILMDLIIVLAIMDTREMDSIAQVKKYLNTRAFCTFSLMILYEL